LISTDWPERNRRFRAKQGFDFALLSDRDHAVADRYGIPISRRHWQAKHYPDGFIQPAVLVFRGESCLFSFIQKPGMLNLWGAAGRPKPEQVFAEIRSQLEAGEQA